jgi:hypothetical protein
MYNRHVAEKWPIVPVTQGREDYHTVRSQQGNSGGCRRINGLVFRDLLKNVQITLVQMEDFFLALKRKNVLLGKNF